MRILLSEDEQERLDQVSPQAERLYRHLRQRMDMSTGTVGRGASAISRAVLAIYCQYLPPRGSHHRPWKPTLNQIDALIDELIRIGLIARAATVAERQKLVLKFPLVSVRLREEPDMNGTEERHTNASAVTVCNQQVNDDYEYDERHTLHGDEADISVFLSEEMRSRPAGAESEANGDVRKQAVRALQAALEPAELADAALFRAGAMLGDEAARRTVSSTEIAQAVAMARARGAGSVASYAAAIVASQSLQPKRAAPAQKRAVLTACPDRAQFPVTDRHRELAVTRGVDLDGELHKFCLFARSRGRRGSDWSAAFELWLINGRAQGPAPQPWYATASGIEAKAKEIGYIPPPGKQLFQWKHEVYRLCGVTEQMWRSASERAASDIL